MLGWVWETTTFLKPGFVSCILLEKWLNNWGDFCRWRRGVFLSLFYCFSLLIMIQSSVWLHRFYQLCFWDSCSSYLQTLLHITQPRMELNGENCTPVSNNQVNLDWSSYVPATGHTFFGRQLFNPLIHFGCFPFTPICSCLILAMI